MPTKVSLDPKFIDRAEVTIHLNTQVLEKGLPGVYGRLTWLQVRSAQYAFTEVGHKLCEQLETLSGAVVRYGQLGFTVQVPVDSNLVDVLWNILKCIRTAVGSDISFATMLGDDAPEETAFISNPSRSVFYETINTMLCELRQRKSSSILEVECVV